MMRAISSLSFSGPLEQKIVAAAQAGFSAIEIFREDLVGFDGTPEGVAALAAENGIAIASLQSLRDFEALPEGERPWALERAGRFLELAARIGAPLLVVCANTRPDTLADPDRAAAGLAALADRAAALGLRIGYEALASGTHVRSYLDAWPSWSARRGPISASSSTPSTASPPRPALPRSARSIPRASSSSTSPTRPSPASTGGS